MLSDQIQDSQDFPFFDAPAPDPPQGPPVLSTDDSGRLDDFFQYFDSNNYNFAFGEGLNFSDAWLSDLPPTFMGTTTSFGQQEQNPHPDNLPSPSHGLSSAAPPDAFHFGQPMIPPTQNQLGHQQRFASQTPLETAAQVDVAAVLTALQNGHQNGHQNNHQNSHLARGSSIGGGSASFPPSNPQNPGLGNMRQQMNQHHVKPQRRRSLARPNPSVEPEHNFGDMMFGNSPLGGPTAHRMSQPPDLQWGSDPSFAKSQAFVPNSREDTHEALERKRIDLLQIFELNKSAATTRASSPIRNGENNKAAADVRGGAKPDDGHVKEEQQRAPLASPIKRRKSKPKEEAEEKDDSLSPMPTKPAAKKRKSTKATDSANGPSESSASGGAAKDNTPGKRRRSTVGGGGSGSGGGGKAPRENLSEAQKRENHIKSEQKRRGAIKEGYQELSQIVPNLGSSGYSKSMMLTMAADWLEDLIRGNEELQQQGRFT